MAEIEDLKKALAFGVSVITSEHFISAGLSSPWSVAKFAETPEDVAQVWKLYRESMIWSAVSSAIIGFLLHDMSAFLWGLAGTAMIAGIVGSEYKRALDGTL